MTKYLILVLLFCNGKYFLTKYLNGKTNYRLNGADYLKLCMKISVKGEILPRYCGTKNSVPYIVTSLC